MSVRDYTTAEGANPGDIAGARGRSVWWDALVALIALVGVADATYLTVEHMSGRSVRCLVVSGCDKVLASEYATVAGTVPLAAAGALAYFAVFSLATLAAFGYRGVRPLLALLVALMFAAALWLLYLQTFVIEAFCTYCLLSAAVTTTLALLLVLRWLFRPKIR